MLNSGTGVGKYITKTALFMPMFYHKDLCGTIWLIMWPLIARSLTPLQHTENENNKELGDQIKKLSPVAWQHISLLGKFVFSKVTESIDIKGVVKNALDKISKN